MNSYTFDGVFHSITGQNVPFDFFRRSRHSILVLRHFDSCSRHERQIAGPTALVQDVRVTIFIRSHSRHVFRPVWNEHHIVITLRLRPSSIMLTFITKTWTHWHAMWHFSGTCDVTFAGIGLTEIFWNNINTVTWHGLIQHITCNNSQPSIFTTRRKHSHCNIRNARSYYSRNRKNKTSAEIVNAADDNGFSGI